MGKQRTAIWLAQLLLCSNKGDEPCRSCENCRYSAALTHPDLHWFFPRPRPKDSDASAEEIRLDYADAIAKRMEASMLYAAPSGSDAIYVATVRTILKDAYLAPAIAKAKVFVIGDAERMVPQEGSEQAANAFLKLLEEPPADTTIILTTSEPGALLPTIRSRLVSYRVSRLGADDTKKFLDAAANVPATRESVQSLRANAAALAAFVRAGAPGSLVDASRSDAAYDQARAVLKAADSGRKSEMTKAAFGLGIAGARGGFADFLDALSSLVHERARSQTESGDVELARKNAVAVFELEELRQLASNNISPQLIGTRVMRALAAASGASTR